MQLCDLLPTTAFVHWENGTSVSVISKVILILSSSTDSERYSIREH